MALRRELLVVVIASIAILAVGICSGLLGASPVMSAGAQPVTAAWTFQGRVYEGDTGTEPPHSQPLEGVIVSVYGANNPYPDTGTIIASTTTDSEGWYGLEVSGGYEYYYIAETDPAHYYSAGATTVDGTVRTSNWVEYAILLDGQTLTGNRFWDRPNAALFEDDFDDGRADGWDLEQGWGIAEEEGRAVLSGSGHFWALPESDGWVDYELVTTLKLVAGTVHINFRYFEEMPTETDLVQKRYYLGLQENRMYVKKQIGTDFFDLYEGDAPFHLGGWHTVKIAVEGTSIQVYVDEEMLVDISDTEDPVMFGGFAFETLDDSQVHIDDIAILGPVWAVTPAYVWTRTGGPSGGLGYDVRIHPGNKKIMFVTDNPSGVNKSYDTGATWVQRNVSITTRTGPSKDEIPIFSLTVDPSNPDILWAGTQNHKGIYRSDDGGESWEKRDNGVIEGNEISFRGFGVHPISSTIVFGGAEIRAAVGQSFFKTKGVIYRTLDSGLNWSPVWYGDNLVRFILFDYNDPLTMYASTGIFDREGWDDQPDRGEGTGVLKSTDGGVSWDEINNGIPDEDGNRFVGFLEMHPANPQVLFAASGNNTWGNGGVFRTTDAGLNWTRVLSDDKYTMVTFSPSEPNVIYAGSARAIFRSDDSGDSWQMFWKPSENSWGPPGVRAGVPIGAVVDPDDPRTIFINNYQGGNFKSTDGGQTWADASRGYTGAKLTSLAIDPENPAAVWAVGRSGPYRSYTAGASWTGLAYSPASFPEWFAVALNPDNSQEVLVADEHEGIILKSTNSGISWTKVFDHLSAGVDCTLMPKAQKCHDGFKAIAYSPSDPSVVYAGMSAERRMFDGLFPARASHGMYKSESGGAPGTWVAINNGLPIAPTQLLNINAIAVHPTLSNTVYIGTWKNGVYKTTDGGQNWMPMNSGLTSADARSLAVDANSPQVVYVGLGEGKGVFKSVNGGVLWGAINSGLSLDCPSYLLSIGRVEQGVSLEKLPDMRQDLGYSSVSWTSIWDIVIDPTDSQTVYAADHHAGVYLSTTGGGNWTPINSGLTLRAVTTLDISSDGEVVYAATWGGGVFRLGDVELQAVYLPLVVRN